MCGKLCSCWTSSHLSIPTFRANVGRYTSKQCNECVKDKMEGGHVACQTLILNHSLFVVTKFIPKLFHTMAVRQRYCMKGEFYVYLIFKLDAKKCN